MPKAIEQSASARNLALFRVPGTCPRCSFPIISKQSGAGTSTSHCSRYALDAQIQVGADFVHRPTAVGKLRQRDKIFVADTLIALVC